jgi:hypothetical protein
MLSESENEFFSDSTGESISVTTIIYMLSSLSLRSRDKKIIYTNYLKLAERNRKNKINTNTNIKTSQNLNNNYMKLKLLLPSFMHTLNPLLNNFT